MSHSHSTQTHHHLAEGATEPDVVDVRSIVRFAVGLTVVVILSHIAMVVTYRVLSSQADAAGLYRVYPLAVDEDSRRPPEPRLQGGVESDNGRLLAEPPEHNPGSRAALRELRAEEAKILGGYAWIDKNQQVVRIPVTEAMKLTLQRGLPARQAAPAAGSVPPAAQEHDKEHGK